MHLLIPLVASVVFVASLVCVKRVGQGVDGHPAVGPMTIMFFSNMAMATAFSFFYPRDQPLPPLDAIWQPLGLATLFMLGLLFTFAAIRRGDVSVATPVFGVKIIIVAVLLSIISDQPLGWSMWVASILAALGIALIQWTGRDRPRNAMLTILLAASASAFYANFDVCLQSLAPQWGRGRLLSVTFWFVAVLSLGFVPWVQWALLRQRKMFGWIILAATLTMLQAFLMTIALAYFGDAARVNIIFALRGMWAVALAWVAGDAMGGNEATMCRKTLRTRLLGASILAASVAIAIIAPFE